MAFLIIVAALFAVLAGMTALFAEEYAYGLLLVSCGAIIAVAGLDAFD